ncbi:MAG: carboxypeptidase-like regulatory domain-containing protein [Acidobacteriia bacterium]|nr:carboxypeptidase-like regulatory domain-containing protein [Terriglobia bacterium]
MFRSKLIVLLTFVATIALAPLLVAQRSDRAVITGLVSDPSGGAVPAAKVTVTDEARRVQTVVETTGTGNYTTPLLILGTYTVRIEKPGFKGFARAGIQLEGGMIFRQDAMLELGAVATTIEVKAASEMINVASPQVSHDLNQKYYQDLPVVMGADMRLAESLLYAQPGFVPVEPNGDPMFRGSGFNSRINGGQTMAVENWMDGAGFGYAMGHEETQESSPPFEAIREMKVITSSFSAQYGRTAGAFVEYVSKSGTNNWHGSVYEYLVNDKLNACGFFCTWKMPVRNNDYGFSVGGPIRKEKTFFFTNLALMNLRQEVSLGYPNTVPIPEFRQGNFSPLLGKNFLQVGTDALGRPVFQGEIFNPGSTRLVNGVPVRDGYGFDKTTGMPITGQANMIPGDDPLLSSVAAKIAALMPPPDRPGLQYNVHGGTSMPSAKLDPKTWLLRVDHTFNPSLKMSTTFWMNERPRIVGCGGVQACDTKYPPTQSEKNTDYIWSGLLSTDRQPVRAPAVRLDPQAQSLQPYNDFLRPLVHGRLGIVRRSRLALKTRHQRAPARI